MSLEFNPHFILDKNSIENFTRTGFIKLRGVFVADPLLALKARIHAEIGAAVDIYATDFSGLKFDICTDEVLDLITQDGFAQLMRNLTGRRLFFAQGIGFLLAKLKDQGLPWHIGIQSFGFQRANDFGCSLWIDQAKLATAQSPHPESHSTLESPFVHSQPPQSCHRRGQTEAEGGRNLGQAMTRTPRMS